MDPDSCIATTSTLAILEAFEHFPIFSLPPVGIGETRFEYLLEYRRYRYLSTKQIFMFRNLYRFEVGMNNNISNNIRFMDVYNIIIY